MSNLLQTGLSWLADQAAAYASETVTYSRDGVGSVTLSAVLGSQLLRVSDGRGNTKVERADRDFIIVAADLVLGGQVTLPQRGDQIYLTLGGVIERFDVMPVGSEAAWRYSDAHKLRLRVHTKSMGVVLTVPAIQDEELTLILGEG